MAKKLVTLPLLVNSNFGAKLFNVEKKRRGRQGILRSMPQQIDALNKEWENAALELRRLLVMRELERDAKIKRINATRLHGCHQPVEGLL